MSGLTLTITEEAGVTTFRETTPEQLVGRLWKHAYFRSVTPWRYMREVAASVRIQTGHRVRYDTAEHFLRDLAATGLIEIDWGAE